MTSRDVAVEHRDGVVVARLEGDVDLANAAMISAQTLQSVPNDALGLVVDLCRVRYIDSVGIRMLFGLVRSLQASRQGLAIAVDDVSPVRKLLKITNFDEVVPLRATVDECIEMLRDGPTALY